MRAENEIQNRIRFLLSRELTRRVERACARLPHHCKHNHSQPLDVRKKLAGDDNPDYNRLDRKNLPVIGLCMLGADSPDDWKGSICEDPIDAQRCPYYDPKATKKKVEDEFNTQIKDLDWVSVHMPEAYGLLWALGSERTPELPWWKRLWFWVIQVRPDPLVLPPPGRGPEDYY